MQKNMFDPQSLVAGLTLPGTGNPPTVEAREMEVIEPELMPMTADYSSLPKEQQEAMKCKDRLEVGANNLAKTMYDMALDLRMAHQMEYAKHWGMSFEEFAEKKLRIGFRTAYDLASVGQFILDYNIKREQAELSGQTKLREIARYVNALPEAVDKYKEVDNLLMEAPTTPVLELKEMLKEKKDALVENPDAAVHKYRMQSQVFKDDEALRIADIVDAAKQMMGKADMETTTELARQVTEFIYTDWFRMVGGAAQSTSLEDWIKFIENNFNVQLVQATDEDNIAMNLTEPADLNINVSMD